MKRFCPKCGSEQEPFVRGFCINCYSADHPLVELPLVLELAHCPRCNRVRYRDKWLSQSPVGIGEILLAKARIKELASPHFAVELEPLPDVTSHALVTITGTIDATPISIQKLLLVKPISGICDNCMKLASYYHEAIVQLRFPRDLEPEEIKDYQAFVKNILVNMRDQDSLAGVIDQFPVQKGIDFLIGSKHAGKKVSESLARKVHGKITRSFKLIGVNQSGKDKKRYTFCVRVE